MRIMAKILFFGVLFFATFMLGLLFYNSQAVQDEQVIPEVTNYLANNLKGYNIDTLVNWFKRIFEFVKGLF